MRGRILTVVLLASALASSAWGATEIMMGNNPSLVHDLQRASASVEALASFSITAEQLQTAGLREAIVRALDKETEKAARINELGSSPSSAAVVGAFVALTDDTALRFSVPTVLACSTFADCVTNANLLCVTFLSGAVASVTAPTGNECPVVCSKGNATGSAIVSCGQ